MRKNFPVDQETHDAVIQYLDQVESKGHGRPSITSWVKAAIMEKIKKDKNHNNLKEVV